MNYNFDYITRCEICKELIRFDNPFLKAYNRVCDDKECIKAKEFKDYLIALEKDL